MRLWVDGQALQTASRVRGIGRYVLNLLRALAARPDVDLRVSLNAGMVDSALAAREVLSQFLAPHQICIWHGVSDSAEVISGFSARRKLSEIALRHHVLALEPDVALAASPFEGMGDAATPFLPVAGFGVPTAAICYDFIPLTFPEQYLAGAAAREAYQRRMAALAQASHLLAISDFTAGEVERLLPGRAVTSVSAGLPEPFNAEALKPEEPEECADSARGSILYVGSLDWRKNVEVIPRAMALLPAPLKDRVVLEIAGAYTGEDQQRIQGVYDSLNLSRAQLRWLGSPDDSALIAHFRRAGVVVQPSILEGFGLTALEAMACGAPVLVSGAGSLPEVVGDADLLFDPHDPHDLARHLAAMLSDPARRARVAAQGHARAATFTWDKVAQRAQAALHPLVSGERPRPSIERLRADARRELATLGGNSGLHKESLIRTMALAEPAPPDRKRLLVDVTATVRDGLATGIQRVVRKMAENLPACHAQVLPTYSVSPCVIHPVALAPDGRLAAGPDTHVSLSLGQGDHLLELDSSWGDIDAHLCTMRAARLVGARVTIVVYDLIPLRAPAFCAQGMPEFFRNWLLKAITMADGILCISRTVADDVFSLLQEIRFDRTLRIGHWPLGADFAPPASLMRQEDLPGADRITRRPRFLVVGTLEPRKGHSIALAAFERLWAEGLDAELTFAGKQGWNVEALVEQLRTHPERGARLHWSMAPSDADLAILYEGADAVITPSFAEGYGLPISEALHAGVTVIASDIPVFREVADGREAVRFFAVGSAQALAETVRDVIATRAAPSLSQGAPNPALSWQQSASAMAERLSQDAWYLQYLPEQPAENERKPVQASATLNPDDITIERVGAAERLSATRSTLLLRISNRAAVALSPADLNLPDNALRLHCAVVLGQGQGEGEGVAATIRAQDIPLGIPAGGSCYLKVEVETPVDGTLALDVAVVDSARGWTSHTYRLPLAMM